MQRCFYVVCLLTENIVAKHQIAGFFFISIFYIFIVGFFLYIFFFHIFEAIWNLY